MDEEFLATLQRADTLIKDLYDRWSKNNTHALLRDYEPDLNLMQLYLETWVLHNFKSGDFQSMIGCLMYTTQAMFLFGYEAAKADRKFEEMIPDSIKNLDVSGIL